MKEGGQIMEHLFLSCHIKMKTDYQTNLNFPLLNWAISSGLNAILQNKPNRVGTTMKIQNKANLNESLIADRWKIQNKPISPLWPSVSLGGKIQNKANSLIFSQKTRITTKNKAKSCQSGFSAQRLLS